MTFDEWMRWETGGKHCDADDSLQTRLLRKCWDAAAVTTRQATIEAMGDFLRCPCCAETMDCVDDCTFAQDCPDDANTLALLRDAVRA